MPSRGSHLGGARAYAPTNGARDGRYPREAVIQSTNGVLPLCFACRSLLPPWTRCLVDRCLTMAFLSGSYNIRSINNIGERYARKSRLRLISCTSLAVVRSNRKCVFCLAWRPSSKSRSTDGTAALAVSVPPTQRGRIRCCHQMRGCLIDVDSFGPLSHLANQYYTGYCR